jgi:hypothetical protein
MADHTRITIRLTPALAARVSDAVRQGKKVSDIICDALEAYFGGGLTARPTPDTTLSASPFAVSDVLSDMMAARLSAVEVSLSALASDVSDIRERLRQLEQRMPALSDPGGHRPTAQPQPVHYGRPGIARETLQAIADEYTLCQGLTMREVAQRLFDKGIYRAKAKDGREVPVDHSRLRRWLEQAREVGLLSLPRARTLRQFRLGVEPNESLPSLPAPVVPQGTCVAPSFATTFPLG